MNIKKYVYIGDLSKKDSSVIQHYAERSNRVLEFGVGGSSQIFAQCCRVGTEIVSVDTNKEWIDTVKSVLVEIEKDRPIANIDFMMHDSFLDKNEGSFDLIFNDGLGRRRLNFALQTWSSLDSNGGILMFHDTRRERDCDNICEIIKRFYNEIERIEMNKDDSNVSIIVKKRLQEYEDWNEKEGKTNWMKNAKDKDRPKEWISVLRDKIHK